MNKSYQRTRKYNFSLDGLLGFDIHGKTVGVIGTGRIGKAFIYITFYAKCIYYFSSSILYKRSFK